MVMTPLVNVILTASSMPSISINKTIKSNLQQVRAIVIQDIHNI